MFRLSFSYLAVLKELGTDCFGQDADQERLRPFCFVLGLEPGNHAWLEAPISSYFFEGLLTLPP